MFSNCQFVLDLILELFNRVLLLFQQQSGGNHQSNPFLSSVQMNVNNPQSGTKQTVLLNNEGSTTVALPSVSATRQIQLHPVTVVASQNGATLVPSQPETGLSLNSFDYYE